MTNTEISEGSEIVPGIRQLLSRLYTPTVPIGKTLDRANQEGPSFCVDGTSRTSFPTA